MNSYYVFFFFSSRRRHTRCLSDWSSDVCSSDLDPFSETSKTLNANLKGRDIREAFGGDEYQLLLVAISSNRVRPASRSEERRVGKECRYRERKRQGERKVTRKLELVRNYIARQR